MRMRSLGHAAFAITMIALGVMGLIKGAFTQIWLPVPKWVPAQPALAYLIALISLACGVGLLVPRASVPAARVLLAAFALWLVVFRLPYLLIEKPLVLVAWSCGQSAVFVAAAWVLADARGHRFARALYGLALIPFGLAHFMYLKETTVLVPTWLPPGPTFWAYFTGAAFIAAGLALVAGVLVRLAAVLSTVEFAALTIIVWIPRVVTGSLSEFQKGEVVSSFAIWAAAWVIADSCRDMPWLKR